MTDKKRDARAALDDNIEDDSTSSKKACTRMRSIQPDVVVVVGGQEFQEYSQLLCSSCDYFDAAFRVGMAESQTKRFDFSDRDPAEWELVRTFFCPFGAKVTMENVLTVVPWFDKLCCQAGMKECKRVVLEDLMESLKSIEAFCTNCGSCRDIKYRYDLRHEFARRTDESVCCPKHTKQVESLMKLMRLILQVYPHPLGNVNLQALVASLLTKHVLFRREMWDIVKENLPPLETLQHSSTNEDALQIGITATLVFSHYVTRACQECCLGEHC